MKSKVRTLITAMAILAIADGSSTRASARQMHDAEVSRAMGFLSALGRHDFDAAGALLDQDAVVDLPYAGAGMTIRGRSDALAFFRRTMGRSVATLEYRLDRAYPSPEAGALVLEVSTQGRTAAGSDYTNRLVTIFVFHRDRIALFREYFNPAKVG